MWYLRGNDGNRPSVEFSEFRRIRREYRTFPILWFGERIDGFQCDKTDIDWTDIWNPPCCATFLQQFALLHNYLSQPTVLAAVGVQTGWLESVALMGHRVIIVDVSHKNSLSSRLKRMSELEIIQETVHFAHSMRDIFKQIELLMKKK